MTAAEKKRFRTIVRSIEGAWYRFHKDGTVWAGQHSVIFKLAKYPHTLKKDLEDNGFRCEMNGKPNTAGEYIIDVFVKEP